MENRGTLREQLDIEFAPSATTFFMHELTKIVMIT